MKITGVRPGSDEVFVISRNIAARTTVSKIMATYYVTVLFKDTIHIAKRFEETQDCSRVEQ